VDFVFLSDILASEQALANEGQFDPLRLFKRTQTHKKRDRKESVSYPAVVAKPPHSAVISLCFQSVNCQGFGLFYFGESDKVVEV
jgi:hypothetical protein